MATPTTQLHVRSENYLRGLRYHCHTVRSLWVSIYGVHPLQAFLTFQVFERDGMDWTCGNVSWGANLLHCWSTVPITQCGSSLHRMMFGLNWAVAPIDARFSHSGRLPASVTDMTTNVEGRPPIRRCRKQTRCPVNGNVAICGVWNVDETRWSH